MDLKTKYLGLELNNPLIVSACTLGHSVDNIRKLEDNGAAAVVLPSIFQEEIEGHIEDIESILAESGAEATTYLPPSIADSSGPQNYLDLIRKARAAVDIPVIASLNGTSLTGWTDYAAQLEEAGANAIELNVYFLPTDLSLTGQQVEQRYVEILKAVKKAVKIPVSMKLSPYFSSLGHMVRQLDAAGADGFVLFNRFYQPDIDLEELTLQRDLNLSHRGEIRLPLLWLGALHGHVKGSLAASSGVQTAKEVVKYLFVGADAVMTASALIRHGVGYMKTLLDGLKLELEQREIESVSRIRGKMSRHAVADPTAFDRANYIKILQGAPRG
ncbi:dihydroorotate dehydrogenase-like protein [Telmatospirillum siberiense]|uniref:Dihydroorotate dehydrogenase n=1 Tax=Telmatospirillum siberiense TaxID=382514 RepID=A0A2N3PXG1_9PROT|nr:dihydroorotate dehydrogenase-like protein [Telmatospirillum siberiense]PKU25075.1 dihydroorotate dehydrogenase [Telmatospirillum siberiense]